MLRIHHLPEGEQTVPDFQVRLDGQETRPWFCRVSAMQYNTVWPGHQRPLDQTEIASFVSFEMDQPISVSLTASKDFEEGAVGKCPNSTTLAPDRSIPTKISVL